MSEKTARGETKFQQVRAGLESLAYQLGPDARFPSVRELTSQFGTGINTLSGALQDLEARDIVIRKHGVGVFVSPSLSRTVCFLVSPDFFARGHSPFWDSLLKAARLRSERGGEKFELHFVQSSEVLGSTLESSLATRLRENQIAGVIGIGLRERAIEWLGEQNVPLVSLFGPFAGPRSVSITFDTPRMIQMGVSRLAQCGCRRMEFWATVLTGLSKAQIEEQPDVHRESFFAALEAQGLARDSGCWRLFCDDLAPNQKVELSPTEQGFEIARRVFSGPRETWPDGVFGGEDIFTHGILMALQNLGIEVGRDVQIATHANSDSTIFLGHAKPLTFVEYDVNEIVEIVHDALEQLLRPTAAPPNGDPTDHTILVAPHLRP